MNVKTDDTYNEINIVTFELNGILDHYVSREPVDAYSCKQVYIRINPTVKKKYIYNLYGVYLEEPIGKTLINYGRRVADQLFSMSDAIDVASYPNYLTMTDTKNDLTKQFLSDTGLDFIEWNLQ